MDKIKVFLLKSKPRLYLICVVLLSLIAKLIESKVPDFAMGLQLIAFVLIFLSIKSYFSSKEKT